MLQLLPLFPVDLRGNLGDSIDGEDEEDNDDVSSCGADMTMTLLIKVMSNTCIGLSGMR